MHLLRRAALFTLLLASVVVPTRAQAADPILMFLLGIARDMVIAHVTRPQPKESAPLVDLDRVYPGTLVEPEQIRRLIDECFGYLSQAQRGEIFDALNEALLNPKNAAVRAPMIDYFVQHALAVRAAQQRLAQMSPDEKRMIAAEFRAATLGMPEEEQAQLSAVLRQGLLPLPDDLGQMMLAALER